MTWLNRDGNLNDPFYEIKQWNVADPFPYEKIFHCSITSIPYYLKREYDGEQVTHWPEVTYQPMAGLAEIAIPEMDAPFGNEPTIEAFVGHVVHMYRNVWKVLRDDGVVWLNIDDTYAHNRTRKVPDSKWPGVNVKTDKVVVPEGIPSGNRMLIPQRLELALQADGWTVRNEVIWHKTNGMVESPKSWAWKQERCTCLRTMDNKEDEFKTRGAGRHFRVTERAWSIPDPDCEICDGKGYLPELAFQRGSWRHTRDYEIIMMLSKGMGYYADETAVAELAKQQSIERMRRGRNESKWLEGAPGQAEQTDHAPRDNDKDRPVKETRNPRAVFSCSTANYKGAHFAVFPPELIYPLMKATVPAKCCVECGQGWAPVLKQRYTQRKRRRSHQPNSNDTQVSSRNWRSTWIPTGNYKPSCDCGIPEWTPGIVFDPCAGTGTVIRLAKEMGISAVGLDISDKYIQQEAERVVFGKTPDKALKELPLFAGLK